MTTTINKRNHMSIYLFKNNLLYKFFMKKISVYFKILYK